MTELSSDWWLSEASALQAPKQEIGDYVESQGFKVPKRFDTLDDALDVVRAGGGLAIRSEHRDEYDGASGLMQTYRLDSDSIVYGRQAFEDYGDFDIDEQVLLSQHRAAITAYRNGDMPGYHTMADVVLGVALDTPTDLTIQRLKQLTGQYTTSRRYADLNGINISELMGEAGFSFWEYKEGSNVTVVADTAIDDRYHVLANSPRRKGMPSYYGWQIANEKGNPTAGSKNDRNLTSSVTEELIKTYEAIRNLPRFASEHCPIMELQLDENGEIWFLQYHRTRDFKAASGSLDPSDFSANEGWQAVDGVRGAVNSPITLKTALWYPTHYGSASLTGKSLPEAEDASMDWHWDWPLSEIMSRRRTAYISDNSRDHIYLSLAAAHAPRSKWFKPLAAIACGDKGLKNLIPEALREEILHDVHRNGNLARVAIDLAADGNIGYVRLNPDSKQPLYNSDLSDQK